MKTFSLLILLFAFTTKSFASECPPKNPCSKVEKKVIKKQSAQVIAPKPSNVSYAEKTQAESKQDSELRNSSEQHAKTGNQTVTVHVPPPKVIIRTINKRVYKKIVQSNPNRLQLLGGVSKSKMDVAYDGCCNLTAKKKHEPDLGLQYLRDFGSFTGSIAGTTRENFYLGVGINW
jgi:hypothetical protein